MESRASPSFFVVVISSESILRTPASGKSSETVWRIFSVPMPIRFISRQPHFGQISGRAWEYPQ
jgi:hypothetical protein